MKYSFTRDEINECMKNALKRVLKEYMYDDEDDMEFNPEGNADDEVVDRALNGQKYAKLSKNKDPKTGKKKKEVSKEFKSARKWAGVDIDDEERAARKDDAAVDRAEQEVMGDNGEAGAYDGIGTEDDTSTKNLRSTYGIDEDDIDLMSTAQLNDLFNKLSSAINRNGGNKNASASNRIARYIAGVLEERRKIFAEFAEAQKEGEEEPPVPWGYKKTGEFVDYTFGNKVYKVPDVVPTHSNFGKRNDDAWDTSGAADSPMFGWGKGSTSDN